jgi:hypothetical protein
MDFGHDPRLGEIPDNLAIDASPDRLEMRLQQPAAAQLGMVHRIIPWGNYFGRARQRRLLWLNLSVFTEGCQD